MADWYMLKGINPMFDGLLVQAFPSDGYGAMMVERMVNRDIQWGDRNLSMVFPSGSFMISSEFLQKVDDPGIREFSTTNPWGKVVEEGRRMLSDMEVAWVLFESGCISVTVLEKTDAATKTLYSHNFFEGDAVLAKEISMDADATAHDVVFRLRRLADRCKDVR